MKSLLSCVLLLFVLTSCASPPPPLQQAPTELTGVIVLVETPEVKGSQRSFAERRDVAQRVQRELQGLLRQQNLRIVTDPAVFHHATLRSVVTVDTGPNPLPVDKRITVEVFLMDGAELIARGSSGRKDVNNDLELRNYTYSTLDEVVLLAANDLFHAPIAWRPGETPRGTVASSSANANQATVRPMDPLVSAAPQPRSYGLIIGVEQYRDLPSPTGARRDAERFRALLTESMGLPERNVRMLLDDQATRGDVLTQLRWLEESVSAGDRVYFYFSGHGSPQTTDGASFLLPYEASLESLEYTGIALTELLSRLEDTGARDVLAFVDACFSGTGGRSLLPEGIRPLVPVQSPPTTARVLLFSASAANQISGTRPGEDVGLFTHHLIDALGRGRADINGDGQISIDELVTYVTPRVENEARQASREQSPSLHLPEDLGSADEIVVTWGISAE
jgi:hypothetical protein